MFILAMTEAMLALLLSLSGHFESGLAALKAGRHEEAITEFTQVIEQDMQENKLFLAARYFRGEAYLAAGKRELAQEDWYAVKNSYRSWARQSDTELKTRAEERMKELGTSAHAMLSPLDVVTRITSPIIQKKWDELMPYLSPELAASWKAETGPPGYRAYFNLVKGNGSSAHLHSTSDTEKNAHFKFAEASFSATLVRRDGCWIITACEPMDVNREPFRSTMANLENIRAAGTLLLARVAAADGAWPISLDTLASGEGAIRPATLRWRSPGETPDTHPLLYLPPPQDGAALAPTDPVIASPVAAWERHVVIRANGELDVMEARDFKAWLAERIRQGVPTPVPTLKPTATH